MRGTFETSAAFSFFACSCNIYSRLPPGRRSIASLLLLWPSACVKPSSSKETQVLPPSERFDYDMEDDDFEELISKGFIPPNTVADAHKCVHLFQEWAKDRYARFPGDKVPDDLMLTDDHQSLSRWFQSFAQK